MKIEKINSWLGLAANCGVIVGLIFLIVEIDQSNRIAVYSAESTRRSQYIEMNTSRIENAETIAKFMHPEAKLNEVEWVQAIYTVRQSINTWIDAENAVLSGLLSEDTYNEIFTDIDVVVAEMPGLKPAYTYILEKYDLESRNLEVLRYLVEAVKKM